MTKPIVETAVFQLREGVSEAELLRASENFQREFLNRRQGFLRRELLKLEDGSYLDLVHWRDREAAEAVLQAASESTLCSAFFALMKSSGDPSQGVTHYESLAVYEA